MSSTHLAGMPDRLPPYTGAWDWQLQAACRDYGDAAFFAPDGESRTHRADRERRAKDICATCPVRTACLQHALIIGEPYGVWGGLTPEERHQLQRPGHHN